MTGRCSHSARSTAVLRSKRRGAPESIVRWTCRPRPAVPFRPVGRNGRLGVTGLDFRALLLDAKNQVIRIAPISVGSLTESIVHPRELFCEAIRHSSAALIVAHNHPSGDPTPSPEDLVATRHLVRAGKILSLAVLDHVIVTREEHRYYSMLERGTLPSSEE